MGDSEKLLSHRHPPLPVFFPHKRKLYHNIGSDSLFAVNMDTIFLAEKQFDPSVDVHNGDSASGLLFLPVFFRVVRLVAQAAQFFIQFL